MNLSQLANILRQNLFSADTEIPHSAQKPVATVLVLLMSEGDSSKIILTKRTQKVLTHKGQVSFPGGYLEKEDQSYLQAALRETKEEIGLPSHQVEIWGQLPSVFTLGAVGILPFVGQVLGRHEFKTNPDEVERLLFLETSRLLEEGLKPVIAEEEGREIKSIGIHCGGELVWGATAKILEKLYEQIRVSLPENP